MTDLLRREIIPRNPFSVTHLPLIARLYLAANRPRRRAARRLVRKPARWLFRRAFHTLRLGGRGGMTIELHGARHALEFDARNTQFHALYLPQYADGYEPETAALLDLLVGDRAVFFDAGANWGYFSLYVASRPGFTGAIHAFEPMPGSFADLAGLVAQAGLYDRITCHRLALSDAAGAGRMTIGDATHSGIARLESRSDGISVARAALDALDLPTPDVVKLDVEGHEGEALAGARQTLETGRPMVIFESWREPARPETTIAPFRLLDGLGYDFYQPAWLQDQSGEVYGFAEREAVAGSILGLVPFVPAQRFLLTDQINVLACHRDRSDDLAAAFDGG